MQRGPRRYTRREWPIEDCVDQTIVPLKWDLAQWRSVYRLFNRTHRKTFILMAKGLDGDEIATILGITEENARKRMERIRKKVRAKISVSELSE